MHRDRVKMTVKSRASQKYTKVPIGIHQSEETCERKEWAPPANLYIFKMRKTISSIPSSSKNMNDGTPMYFKHFLIWPDLDVNDVIFYSLITKNIILDFILQFLNFYNRARECS